MGNRQVREKMFKITNHQRNAKHSTPYKTNNFLVEGNVHNSFGSASNKPKIKRYFETIGEF